jgi:hypothetical protein
MTMGFGMWLLAQQAEPLEVRIEQAQGHYRLWVKPADTLFPRGAVLCLSWTRRWHVREEKLAVRQEEVDRSLFVLRPGSAAPVLRVAQAGLYTVELSCSREEQLDLRIRRDVERPIAARRTLFVGECDVWAAAALDSNARIARGIDEASDLVSRGSSAETARRARELFGRLKEDPMLRATTRSLADLARDIASTLLYDRGAESRAVSKNVFEPSSSPLRRDPQEHGFDRYDPRALTPQAGPPPPAASPPPEDAEARERRARQFEEMEKRQIEILKKRIEDLRTLLALETEAILLLRTLGFAETADAGAADAPEWKTMAGAEKTAADRDSRFGYEAIRKGVEEILRDPRNLPAVRERWRTELKDFFQGEP